jgi:protein-S-isoprenylcysteine O-methyltransferase Ste14
LKRDVLSIAGFAVAVAALIVLYYTRSLWGVGPVSIGLQVLAGLWMLWARLTFGLRSFHAGASTTEGALVTQGPFALMRNPIYAAVLLFAWTGVAVHPSAVSVACGLAITAGMLVRVFSEERQLRARYGAEYAAYAQRVRRLVPFVF